MYTLDEFKEDFPKRRFQYSELYRRMLTAIEKIYSDKELRFFYPKNLFSDEQKPASFVFVYDEFILIVNKDSERDLVFREIKGKVVEKVLITSRRSDEQHTLKIKLENNEEIIFDNFKDCNEYWTGEYSEYLQDLYKLL